MINICLQSFGRKNEYHRAILAIWSFYAHAKTSIQDTRVILFTDQPGYFDTYLTGLPVHYVLLTPEKIRSMRGTIDFLHRMKIAMIEEAFSIAQNDLLYVDSDTFFVTDPLPAMSTLSPQKSFMHLCEYSFDTLKDVALPAGKAALAFYNLITSQSFRYADGTLCTISKRHHSWNAGVMFLHRSVAHRLPDVYALTEQLYPATQNHASEQFAFSIVLENTTTLHPCDDVVYHYWYRVKKQIIDVFLAKRLTTVWAALPLPEKVAMARQWTVLLPDYMEQHVFTQRDNAIQYFNTDQFSKAYRSVLAALAGNPFNFGFLRDVLYHTRRFIYHKR